LEFRPGSHASYSNTNYLVLAEILERVTRRSLARLLRERIFTPLGLRATAYESGRRLLGDDRLHGYDVHGTSPRDVSLHGLGGPWADGAIVSNARDLAVFFGALLRGRLVPARLVAPDEDDRARLAGPGHGPLQARITMRAVVLRTHRRDSRLHHVRRGLEQRWPHVRRRSQRGR
jgi:CubicO group peptidase (beta-lactamase class C family)